jgi:hypothetical protein
MISRLLLRECKAKIARGETQKDVIEYLHAGGATIVDTMKAIVMLYDVPLRQSKEIVTQEECWREVAGSGDDFHAELEELLQNLPPDQA